ncbi:redoxin domain-containing protein [Devosia sp. PTR5]|uniref:Redoxin domain-containing protein n=1 Tax=Devosia oryzisoli TaxID=2774138 RepID=A0A927ITZ6_9HYPH|nr:redoxin domain-containing protein [Devosia oryzisoli]MBD8067069.1 redoxin domain-containing protein [Devosia oryzisoli]
MSDTSANQPRGRGRFVLPGLVGLVVCAGVAIAAWFYLGNSAQANSCKAQPAAAQIIDTAATGELAALMGTGQGRGYADLAFKDEAGAAHTIADFEGKALLVNFWASWCIPCREEMPALDQIAGEFNSDKFKVLPINLDIGEGGLEKAKAFLAEGGFENLPLYADNSFAAFDRLKREAVAVGLPATLLLDPDGCELAVLQGPAEWQTEDGKAVVKALIGLRG